MISFLTRSAFTLSSALLLLAFPAFSQENKTEKVEKVLIGIGAQYNLPARYFNRDIDQFDDRNSGMGFYIEPKLLKCNFLFGLKAEYASVQEIFQTDAISSYDLISLSPTVKYLFLDRKHTPYIGFGTGLFYAVGVKNNFNLGVEPSIGFIFHKVQLSLNYNRILNDVKYDYSKGFGNYYLALKLGVEL